MFRSPISPARCCTFASNSARNVSSSGESAATLEGFFPGIRIPTHQSKRKNATTANAIRRALRQTRRNVVERPLFKSTDLLSEPEGADAEEEDRHSRHDGEGVPVFEEVRSEE